MFLPCNRRRDSEVCALLHPWLRHPTWCKCQLLPQERGHGGVLGEMCGVFLDKRKERFEANQTHTKDLGSNREKKQINRMRSLNMTKCRRTIRITLINRLVRHRDVWVKTGMTKTPQQEIGERRKMLRFIIQTKRKYKKIEKKKILSPKKKRKMLTSPKFVALMTKVTMVRAQSLKMMWTAK